MNISLHYWQQMKFSELSVYLKKYTDNSENFRFRPGEILLLSFVVNSPSAVSK